VSGAAARSVECCKGGLPVGVMWRANAPEGHKVRWLRANVNRKKYKWDPLN
jgi:hypothetical protein